MAISNFIFPILFYISNVITYKVNVNIFEPIQICKPEASFLDFHIPIYTEYLVLPIDGIILFPDMPANSKGFDLGNGLYFDMNGNISLRINKLVNYKNYFENAKIRIANDSLFNIGLNGKRKYIKHIVKGKSNTQLFIGQKIKKGFIVENDSSTFTFIKNSRKKSFILQEKNLVTGKKRQYIKSDKEKFILKNNYEIFTNAETKEVVINRKYGKYIRPFYKIKYQDNQIQFIRKNKVEKSIIFTVNSVNVYRNINKKPIQSFNFE